MVILMSSLINIVFLILSTLFANKRMREQVTLLCEWHTWYHSCFCNGILLKLHCWVTMSKYGLA